MALRDEIAFEAVRLIRRHEQQAQSAADETRRRRRRSLRTPDELSAGQPPHWALADGFNPYLTRSRADRVAHSISEQLRSRAYRPRQPVEFMVPKPSGGERAVSIFQVADSAVSRVVYENLLAKNLPLLSARAYAYRKDITSQDAIQYVLSEVVGRSRLFVAEFDFSKYFDSIDHEHVLRNLNDCGFVMSGVERSVIESFLTTAAHTTDNYVDGSNSDRYQGVPQGTSISLFLANVAAWKMDRDLEHAGVGFTRYADDTLIWSNDYSAICRAVAVLESHASRMGVQLNLEKSPGIHLLAISPERAEIASVASVNYLGYALGPNGASIKATAEGKIKHHIERLIYWNLLHEPMRGSQNPAQVSSHVDRDYVTLLSQLRSYLYGDLSERTVQRYQRGEIPPRRFKGVMAAYPLISDDDQLAALDGWLVNTVFTAMAKRARLLSAMGIAATAPPHGLELAAFCRAKTKSQKTGETIDLRIPSFRRIARVMRRASVLHGASRIGRPSPYGFAY